MNTNQAKQAIARALHELNTFCNDYSEGDMGAIKGYVRDFHKVICELEAVLKEPVERAGTYSDLVSDGGMDTRNN